MNYLFAPLLYNIYTSNCRIKVKDIIWKRKQEKIRKRRRVLLIWYLPTVSFKYLGFQTKHDAPPSCRPLIWYMTWKPFPNHFLFCFLSIRIKYWHPTLPCLEGLHHAFIYTPFEVHETDQYHTCFGQATLKTT